MCERWRSASRACGRTSSTGSIFRRCTPSISATQACSKSMLAAGGWRRPVPLGPIGELRQRLPLTLEVDGISLRIMALEDGEIVAHSTVCPHWRGPLDACLPQVGILQCPWHGYRFDLRTGLSADGCSYRLAPAARVDLGAITGVAMLIPL